MRFEKLFLAYAITCITLGLLLTGFIIWIIIKLLQYWSII